MYRYGRQLMAFPLQAAIDDLAVSRDYLPDPLAVGFPPVAFNDSHLAPCMNNSTARACTPSGSYPIAPTHSMLACITARDPRLHSMKRLLIVLSEIIQIAKTHAPIFSPNDRSTYSNIAFSLLGLALEKSTGKTYAEIILSSILEPLGMHHTSLTKPKDSAGIIPSGPNYWRPDLGPDNP